MSDRIPFEEAVSEPLLFKSVWNGDGSKHNRGFTAPQKMVLKSIYGLGLTDEELAWWSALNGKGRFDDLGYLKGIEGEFAYVPREMTDITFIFGRRWSKTSLSSFVIAYEALCGGHHEHVGRSKRQIPVFIQIAQDLDTARTNLRQHILSFLESSPIGRKELGDLQQSVTANEIRLPKALIEVDAPSIKVRGKAVAVCAFDELAYWQKDIGAAAQDIEIERAVKPAMNQFPHRKLLKMSSPATKQGLLWSAFETGTYGCRKPEAQRKAFNTTLVLKGPTATSGNPVVVREELARERLKDPDGFRREFLAEFSDSISGFLAPDALQAAVKRGVRSRPPQKNVRYAAAIDAAFKRDAFTFCIGHMEDGAFVQDVLTGWRGAPGVPLSPTQMLHKVALLAAPYGVRHILSDQHHLESLQELAQQFGIVIEPAPLTNESKQMLWGNFSLMLNQGKLQLLDHEEQLQELAALERHLTPTNNVQYRGKRDDYAMVTALALTRAMQLGEAVKRSEAAAPTTHHDLFWDVRRRTGQTQKDGPWWA